jgi:hypothetical protein
MNHRNLFKRQKKKYTTKTTKTGLQRNEGEKNKKEKGKKERKLHGLRGKHTLHQGTP